MISGGLVGRTGIETGPDDKATGWIFLVGGVP